ncbi:MAG: hypothetical protein HW384_1344 [Dehalococcoidia bacterium]|nr:hypothetical protein [Dehalococcoidia bacterium]
MSRENPSQSLPVQARDKLFTKGEAVSKIYMDCFVATLLAMTKGKGVLSQRLLKKTEVSIIERQ